MAEAGRCTGAEYDRRRRHVVGRRRVAGDTGRVRRHARGGVFSLHADDARLWRRRHHDGAVIRPLRRSIAADRCHLRVGDRLRRGELVVELADVRDRAGSADRHARQLRKLRSVVGGHFALVRAATWARSFDRRVGQLSGGRRVAADRAVSDRNGRLALGAPLHRRDLPADDAAVDVCDAARTRRMWQETRAARQPLRARRGRSAFRRLRCRRC